MREEELEGLGPALSAYLEPYLYCCEYTQTFGHLKTYVRGLLSDLQRKTCEPIALKAGCAVRTLQEFLRDHLWDFASLRDRLQRHAAALLPSLPPDELGTVALVDETSSAKRGDKTPGTARQYLGCLGKVDNGIVTVHTGVCKGTFKALLDFDLYLPKGWDQDRKRCRAAGIPDTLVYRPKWQIALGQLDRLKAQGISPDWLTFDEEYGKAPGFLYGLDERQLRFVGEVPKSFSCLAVNRAGRRPGEGVKGRAAQEVVRRCVAFASQPWRVLRLRRQEQEDSVWRVKAARVWLRSAGGWSAGAYWLVWASNDQTGEEKFFCSNAPGDAEVEVLLRVAFRRWNVEHSFGVCKGELGFTHFEGRNYVALMRHLGLSVLALAFVAEHTQRLRGGKSGADDGAGLPWAAAGVPGLAGATAADERTRLAAGGHRLSPGTQPRRPAVQEEEATRGPDPQEAPTTQAKTTKPMHRKIKVALSC